MNDIWIVLALYECDAAVTADDRTGTARFLADIAADLPGYVDTRLYQGDDAHRLTFVTRYDLEQSARTYAAAAHTAQDHIADAFRARRTYLGVERMLTQITAGDAGHA